MDIKVSNRFICSEADSECLVAHGCELNPRLLPNVGRGSAVFQVQRMKRCLVCVTDEPLKKPIPLHEQTVKDEKGRYQRFHGAFTGGFSAGYFNTVGSKEGG